MDSYDKTQILPDKERARRNQLIFGLRNLQPKKKGYQNALQEQEMKQNIRLLKPNILVRRKMANILHLNHLMIPIPLKLQTVEKNTN